MEKQRREILGRGIILFVVTVLLSAIAFKYIDRTVALWFSTHEHIPKHALAKISVIPSFFEVAALLVYIIYFSCWLYSKRYRLLTRCLNIANCITITFLFKVWAKYIFGRLMPLPSISTHDFGFHFLHGGDFYIAFPSGHSAIAATTLTAIFLNYPLLRFPAILFIIAVPISLVMQNFHFVSDTIAGAGLGCLIAYWYHAIISVKAIEKQYDMFVD